MSQLKITATNEIIPLESSSMSTDIEQFVWSFNAVCAIKEDLQKLIPPANLGRNFIEVTYTLGSETWALIIEDSDCKDTQFSYSVTGKSKSIVLAEPYAKTVTKVWLNSSAEAICEELCNDAGITLSWLIMDWSIAYYSVEKRYPIDIINDFVREIGAKLQTLPDGTLVVMTYPDSPQTLRDTTASYTIDTLRNVFDRGEKFVNRQNYDCIFVTNDATLLDAPNVSIEEVGNGDDKLLYVYANPLIAHNVLNLHCVGDNAHLTYEGTETEWQVDDVIITQGEGRLSKQFTSLVSVKWQQDEVGRLTIAHNGRITCARGETGLATITYNTTYLKYRLQRMSNIAKTLLMSDELLPPVFTTGTNPALPVIVKTLSQAACAVRANAELWSQYDTKEYTLITPYEGAAVLCGHVAKVNIIRESFGFNAWVKSVAINSTGNEISQTVVVEMPCF